MTSTPPGQFGQSVNRLSILMEWTPPPGVGHTTTLAHCDAVGRRRPLHQYSTPINTPATAAGAGRITRVPANSDRLDGFRPTPLRAHTYRETGPVPIPTLSPSDSPLPELTGIPPDRPDSEDPIGLGGARQAR